MVFSKLFDLTTGVSCSFKKVAAGLCVAATLSGGASADTFTVGIVPQFEPKRLYEIWMPILKKLEEKTGHTFNMVGTPRIDVFEAGYRSGAFDFAYMNPYHFIGAEDTQGYIPLIRDNGRALFGVLVVAKNSDIQTVADLEGKTIAFPSPNALGATLLMRADLDRIYKLEFEHTYVKTHSSGYLNVALGQMDAAGGVMATFNAAPPEVRDRLRIILETTTVKTHPFVVHKRVPSEVATAVQQAILEMSATEDGRALLSQIPILDAITARSDDYTFLRSLDLEKYSIE